MLAAGQAHISTEELGLRGPRHRFQLAGVVGVAAQKAARMICPGATGSP